jgi:alanine dehydrogenase
VTILGGGVVGCNAAKIAAGCRAHVTILDVDMDRLRYLDDVMPAGVEVLYSDKHTIRQKLADTDLLIGAVLIPGARAPRLIERADLGRMKPGSVIVDVAIDQGGCMETSRPTTHRDPVYLVDGVLHYCVANIPGAVGRTSTFALCNVTLPWASRIAGRGLLDAAKQWRPIASAINTYQSRLTNPAVAAAFDMPYSATFAA